MGLFWIENRKLISDWDLFLIPLVLLWSSYIRSIFPVSTKLFSQEQPRSLSPLLPPREQPWVVLMASANPPGTTSSGPAGPVCLSARGHQQRNAAWPRPDHAVWAWTRCHRAVGCLAERSQGLWEVAGTCWIFLSARAHAPVTAEGNRHRATYYFSPFFIFIWFFFLILYRELYCVLFLFCNPQF